MAIKKDTIELPRRKAPVLTVRSEQPGPCVAVTTNIHGDESTGVGVVHNLRDASRTC